MMQLRTTNYLPPTPLQSPYHQVGTQRYCLLFPSMGILHRKILIEILIASLGMRRTGNFELRFGPDQKAYIRC